MNAKLRTMLLLTGLTALTSLVAPVAYADQPSLLVVSDDADQETVPRNNRIFNRVITALGEEMSLRGYTVVDEVAAGLDITAQGRVRRRDAELIDIARAIRRPPVDAVVVFQIYASAKKSLNSDVMRPEARISGRIVNVRTSQMLGAFEVVERDLPVLPFGCDKDRECVLEQMGDHARVLARDLGAALAEKLVNFRPGNPGPLTGPGPLPGPGAGAIVHAPADGCNGFPQAFTVILDGFNNQELTKAEEYMAAFKCFDHMRPVQVRASVSEYWYETQTDAARLNHSLRVMLDHMGLPGQISVAGNVVKVVKIGTR
jgi:hypothetical protein